MKVVSLKKRVNSSVSAFTCGGGPCVKRCGKVETKGNSLNKKLETIYSK